MAIQLINFGVYYDDMLKQTFTNEVSALRYIKRELQDPNAEKKKFSIKQI